MRLKSKNNSTKLYSNSIESSSNCGYMSKFYKQTTTNSISLTRPSTTTTKLTGRSNAEINSLISRCGSNSNQTSPCKFFTIKK